MNYFIFKGIDSRQFGNLIVNELPSIIKAAPKVDKYEVDGRSGSLNVSSGAYSSIVKSVQCTLLDLSNVDEVLKWLDGTGEVIFSNQPDKYFKASIVNQISLDRVLYQFRSFIVEFECDPEAYHVNESKLEFTEPSTFLGKGSKNSSPIITVFGDGDIELNINNKIISLLGVDGHLTIDSFLYQVHKDKVNQGKKMIGYFPTLTPGVNTISWTGNIKKILIEPNWINV